MAEARPVRWPQASSEISRECLSCCLLPFSFRHLACLTGRFLGPRKLGGYAVNIRRVFQSVQEAQPRLLEMVFHHPARRGRVSPAQNLDELLVFANSIGLARMESRGFDGEGERPSAKGL